MFLTLKKWTEKKPGTTKNKIWIPQIENPGTIFKYFLGDDGLFEWSDVLKNMYAWGRGFHDKNTRWGGAGMRFKI